MQHGGSLKVKGAKSGISNTKKKEGKTPEFGGQVDQENQKSDPKMNNPDSNKTNLKLTTKSKEEANSF